MRIPKLLADPKTALAVLTELRQRVNALNELAGPELKKFACTYDIPWGTLSRLTEYGENLLKKAVAVQEAVEALSELLKNGEEK